MGDVAIGFDSIFKQKKNVMKKMYLHTCYRQLNQPALTNHHQPQNHHPLHSCDPLSHHQLSLVITLVIISTDIINITIIKPTSQPRQLLSTFANHSEVKSLDHITTADLPVLCHILLCIHLHNNMSYRK